MEGGGVVGGDMGGVMGGVWGDMSGMMGGGVGSGNAEISVAELERLCDEMDAMDDMLAARDFEKLEQVSESVWISDGSVCCACDKVYGSFVSFIQVSYFKINISHQNQY